MIEMIVSIILTLLNEAVERGDGKIYFAVDLTDGDVRSASTITKLAVKADQTSDWARREAKNEEKRQTKFQQQDRNMETVKDSAGRARENDRKSGK